MPRAIILAALILAGCVQTPRARPLSALEIATAPYQEAASEEHLGSLMYEGGCLMFRDDQKKQWLLPVWPDGSMFNGSMVTFHQPAKSDQRVAVAEEIVIDGRPASWQELASPKFEPFSRQCRVPPFFVTGVRPAN